MCFELPRGSASISKPKKHSAFRKRQDQAELGSRTGRSPLLGLNIRWEDQTFYSSLDLSGRHAHHRLDSAVPSMLSFIIPDSTNSNNITTRRRNLVTEEMRMCLLSRIIPSLNRNMEMNESCCTNRWRISVFAKSGSNTTLNRHRHIPLVHKPCIMVLPLVLRIDQLDLEEQNQRRSVIINKRELTYII
jgi:hypothetical protein